MAHTVYSAFNKPFKLLRIDYRLLGLCGGCTFLVFVAFWVSRQGAVLLLAPVVFGVAYTVCWYLTRNDPQYVFLLIDKYTKPRLLDPLERSNQPGIEIIHDR